MVQQNSGDRNSEILWDKQVEVLDIEFNKILFVHFPHKFNKSEHYYAKNFFFLGVENDNNDRHHKPYIMAYDIDDGTELFKFQMPLRRLPGAD